MFKTTLLLYYGHVYAKVICSNASRVCER